jgi:cytochrome c nitrite reductase small subunit
MGPIVKSLQDDDGSLASTHYTRGLVRRDEACFTCHSGYGIWGGIDAKMAGVMHMVRTVTGRYELPLEHHGPFDIDSCLGCHAQTKTFGAVEAHQDADLQKQLLSRELSCTGICHPAAHPESALMGGGGPVS